MYSHPFPLLAVTHRNYAHCLTNLSDLLLLGYKLTWVFCKNTVGGKIFLLEPSQFLLQRRTVCSSEETSQSSEQKNIAINWHRQKLQKQLPMFIPQSKELYNRMKLWEENYSSELHRL